MPWFRVEFFKEITGDSGQQVHALQGLLDVDADDPGEAVEAAKRQFCREREIRDWRINADHYEVHERPT
jgi:hypothetical protein